MIVTQPTLVVSRNSNFGFREGIENFSTNFNCPNAYFEELRVEII